VGITWAFFIKRDGVWEFAGTTPHDEKALEFQETQEEEGGKYAICILED
jgi:hypothetical protein